MVTSSGRRIFSPVPMNLPPLQDQTNHTTRGVAAIDSTIDSSIVSNLTTTIDFFNSKGTISIVDAIKHVEKTNVMTKIIFKI
jgi:hypothetical protein